MIELLEGKQKVKLGVLMSPGLDSYLGINWCKVMSSMHILSLKLTTLYLNVKFCAQERCKAKQGEVSKMDKNAIKDGITK